jgi:hypothetical protein
MQIDKKNGNICFNEENHAYFEENDPECKYISVTTLIHKFTQPFDKEFWSAYKALEKLIPKEYWAVEKKSLQNTKRFDESILELYSISKDEFNKVQQNILDEWEEENRKSCDRGTAIHLELENSFYAGGDNVNLQKFGIGGKFTCKKDYSDLDLKYGVYPEYLIHKKSKDGLMRIAGQVDLIVKSGNDIVIIDHKGLALDTPILTKNGWSTMKDLKVNDQVFDMDGNLCNVTVKSEVHYNPCYKITFNSSDSIIADCDHRWLVTKEGNDVVLTTLELKEYLSSSNTKTLIKNAKPLVSDNYVLPIDPYLLGVWLSSGNISNGTISQPVGSSVWVSLRDKGFELSENLNHGNDGIITRTVFGFVDLLEQIGLLNNKCIPAEYLMSSREDKQELLRGVLESNVDYISNELIQKFLYSFGGNDTYRIVESIEEVPTVPTQCIMVDSPSHTYLCGESLIVTHNTNKEIKTKGGFNSQTRATTKMKYPLNNLDDCNFYHYSLQLSTYAWMLQQINPEFVIKDLILNHYDHKGNNTLYHCEYLKHDVERMLAYYKKQLIRQQQLDRRTPIEY